MVACSAVEDAAAAMELNEISGDDQFIADLIVAQYPQNKPTEVCTVSSYFVTIAQPIRQPLQGTAIGLDKPAKLSLTLSLHLRPLAETIANF